MGTILVIDDEKKILKMLQMALEAYGYRVEVASQRERRGKKIRCRPFRRGHHRPGDARVGRKRGGPSHPGIRAEPYTGHRNIGDTLASGDSRFQFGLSEALFHRIPCAAFTGAGTGVKSGTASKAQGDAPAYRFRTEIGRFRISSFFPHLFRCAVMRFFPVFTISQRLAGS